ncbi:MAG: hypothetical protein JST22_05385 [Bacteroidetes bacterium]|nr:hypothetical protein [Bacteroidota bacterium]
MIEQKHCRREHRWQLVCVPTFIGPITMCECLAIETVQEAIPNHTGHNDVLHDSLVQKPQERMTTLRDHAEPFHDDIHGQESHAVPPQPKLMQYRDRSIPRVRFGQCKSIEVFVGNDPADRLHLTLDIHDEHAC